MPRKSMLTALFLLFIQLRACLKSTQESGLLISLDMASVFDLFWIAKLIAIVRTQSFPDYLVHWVYSFFFSKR